MPQYNCPCVQCGRACLRAQWQLCSQAAAAVAGGHRHRRHARLGVATPTVRIRGRRWRWVRMRRRRRARRIGRRRARRRARGNGRRARRRRPVRAVYDHPALVTGWIGGPAGPLKVAYSLVLGPHRRTAQHWPRKGLAEVAADCGRGRRRAVEVIAAYPIAAAAPSISVGSSQMEEAKGEGEGGSAARGCARVVSAGCLKCWTVVDLLGVSKRARRLKLEPTRFESRRCRRKGRTPAWPPPRTQCGMPKGTWCLMLCYKRWSLSHAPPVTPRTQPKPRRSTEVSHFTLQPDRE